MPINKQRMRAIHWIFLAAVAVCSIILIYTYPRIKPHLDEPIPRGTLIFYSNEAPYECLWPLDTWDHIYGSDGKLACPSVGSITYPDYIQLKHAPSALTITIFQAKTGSGCNADSFKYRIVFKTRKNDVSTEPYNIDHFLRAAETDLVVAPGLQVIEVSRDSDIGPTYGYYKNISCISVRRSD